MVEYTIASVPDPTDPPRKTKRAKRPEPDFDPSKPHATIELETADLLNMGQSGLVQPVVNKTRELQTSDLEELYDGAPVEESKIIVDLGPDPNAQPNVVVDPALEHAARAVTITDARRTTKISTPINVQRVTATVPRVEVSTPRTITRSRASKPRGMGLVVFVYVVSAAALAVSIYLRWFA